MIAVIGVPFGTVMMCPAGGVALAETGVTLGVSALCFAAGAAAFLKGAFVGCLGVRFVAAVSGWFEHPARPMRPKATAARRRLRESWDGNIFTPPEYSPMERDEGGPVDAFAEASCKIILGTGCIP